MDSPDINEEIFKKNPCLFEEPTLFFSNYGGGYEGTKSKISGLANNLPFDVNTGKRPFDKINLLPVVPDNKGSKKNLLKVLKSLKNDVWKYNSNHYSFQDLFNCEFDYLPPDRWYTVKNFSRSEYEKTGKTISDQQDFRAGNKRNIVVFITQTSASSRVDLDESEYFGMKQALVKGFLPSQSLSLRDGGIINQAKANNLDRFSLINLASQIYAKVGGIPWSLKQPADQTYAEINIGIRAGRPRKAKSNYIYGIAQVFSKDGKWIDTAVETKEQPLSADSYELPKKVMKRLLKRSISDYVNKVQSDTPLEGINRINLHKPKGFNDSEIEAVKEFSLTRDTDFCLIGLTRSKIRLFTNKLKNAGNIRRGYFKSLNKNAALLCTTGDYKTIRGDWKGHRLGTPVPLLIQVAEDDEFVTPPIKNVAHNIFVMTRLNWGNVMSREVSEPITVYYAKKVADMAAHRVKVGKVTEDVPWFL